MYKEKRESEIFIFLLPNAFCRLIWKQGKKPTNTTFWRDINRKVYSSTIPVVCSDK